MNPINITLYQRLKIVMESMLRLQEKEPIRYNYMRNMQMRKELCHFFWNIRSSLVEVILLISL